MPITFTRKTWADYSGPPFLQASEINRLETAIDALINGADRAVQISGDTMTGGLVVPSVNISSGALSLGGTVRYTNGGIVKAVSLEGTAYTAGRMAYYTTGGALADSASLLWNNSRKEFGVGTDYTAAGTSNAVSEGGETLIASGNYLSGLYELRWDATNRVERMWVEISTQPYDPVAVITVRQYFSYGSAKCFPTINVYQNAANDTRYITVITSNLNGGTAGINLVAKTMDQQVVLGGALPGSLTLLKTIGTINNTAGLRSTGTVAGGALVAGGVGADSQNTLNLIRGPAGFRRYLGFQTGVTDRWAIEMNTTAEAGSNAGSNLLFTAYDDAGTKIDDWATVIRAAGGAITFQRPANFTQNMSIGGSQFLSTGKALAVISAQVTAAAGTGSRLGQWDASGNLSATIPVPTAFAQTILDDVDAAAVRTTIGAQTLDAKLTAISAGENAARVWISKYSATVNGYASSNTGRLRYGNGVWLYLSAGATTLLKSTNDGVSWSVITPGATFQDVCWHSGASLWVAVGTNICYTSPDGTTWTSRTIPAGSWRACASNGTTVIAGSGTCTVAYSTNATSWTSATTPSGVVASGFTSACWAPTVGKFLLIGSGNASTSATGTGSWSTIVNPASGGMWCGELGGQFVSVDSGYPAFSPDGVTWNTPRRTPVAKGSYQGFATNGVVGFIGGYTEETQAVSTDGETWLPVDFGYAGSFHGVGYGNGWFLVIDDLGFVLRSRG